MVEEKMLAGQKQEITAFKQCILSDEKILYLYSAQKRVLHEKHCCHVREILDENLRWLETYASELEQCSECAAAAYIRIGAKDPEAMASYLSLLDRMQMPIDLIRSMYLDLQMRTMIHHDTIVVWYKEDTWKIRALPGKGRVQLFHNNYIVKNGGMREFGYGFHIQNKACKNAHISYVMKIIEGYSFKPEEAKLHKNIA